MVTPAEENAREEDEEEEKAKDRRLPAKKEFKRGESGSLVPVVPVVVVVEGEKTRIREDILQLVIGKKKLAATPRFNDFWSLVVVVVAFFSLLTLLLPLPDEKREERSARRANTLFNDILYICV
ncbi:hypothetical protein PQY76_00205 [bacterium]|nr:hypothetical protein [bacterium]